MWLASVGRGIIAPKTGEIAGERVHFGSIVTAACAWECRLDFMCIKCVRNFNYVLWQEKKLKNQKKNILSNKTGMANVRAYAIIE